MSLLSKSFRISAPLVLALLFLTATAGVVLAKGGSSALRSATLSGGGLSESVTTGISIPDQSYEMRGLHVVQYGIISTPGALATLESTPLPYEVVLHYDYGERYGGKQDRLARYDGARLLGFANGDWYEASPKLGSALRTELFWGFAPAEVRGVRGGGIDPYTAEILIVLGALSLLFLGHHVWKGNNEVASPAEVESRMRNRPVPDAIIHF